MKSFSFTKNRRAEKTQPEYKLFAVRNCTMNKKKTKQKSERNEKKRKMIMMRKEGDLKEVVKHS